MARAATSGAARAILVVAAVTAIGGGLRLWDLGTPDRKIFDEVYYASDGCLYAGIDRAACGVRVTGERSWVHPPLGKHLISWGVHGFGNRPVGWRVAAAAAGTATIPVVGALAWLLLRRAAWAGVAAALVAAEHLHFVQSRIAMLDVFLLLFVVAGFLALVADRVRQDRRDRAAAAAGPAPPPVPPGPTAPVAGDLAFDPSGPSEPDGRTAVAVAERPPAAPGPLPSGGVRPLRLLAGALLAAAVAVKWSGILALASAAVLALAWERTRRKRAGRARPLAGAVIEEGPRLLLAFGLLPLVVYAAAWAGWMADRGVGDVFGHHVEMARYHFTLSPLEDGEPIHPYMSRAWTWLLLLRPVAYFWEGNGTAREILGIGNPLVFWGSLIAIPYLALTWAAGRDWRAGAVLVPLLGQYLPWIFVSRPLFLFYMAPITPFLALAITYVLRDVAASGRRGATGGVVSGTVVAVAVGLFAFFWPVLVGREIARASWEARMWLSSWV